MTNPKKEEQKQEVKVEAEVKQPVMMAIGKKKKIKEEESKDASYPTKFKFDENFSHGI